MLSSVYRSNPKQSPNLQTSQHAGRYLKSLKRDDLTDRDILRRWERQSATDDLLRDVLWLSDKPGRNGLQVAGGNIWRGETDRESTSPQIERTRGEMSTYEPERTFCRIDPKPVHAKRQKIVGVCCNLAPNILRTSGKIRQLRGRSAVSTIARLESDITYVLELALLNLPCTGPIRNLVAWGSAMVEVFGCVNAFVAVVRECCGSL